METLGADRSRITAAIGPTIARSSYEVDDGFRLRFVDADPGNERFFAGGRAGHSWFDLEGYNAAILAAAGIGRIEAMGLDTYSGPDRRSEEHTSELQSLMRTSYAVFCLKKKKKTVNTTTDTQ